MHRANVRSEERESARLGGPVGSADHLPAKDDLYLALGGLPRNRFEPRLLGRVRIEAFDVAFQLAHEEEKSHDPDGPQNQHRSEEDLIGLHERECLKCK